MPQINHTDQHCDRRAPSFCPLLARSLRLTLTLGQAGTVVRSFWEPCHEARKVQKIAENARLDLQQLSEAASIARGAATEVRNLCIQTQVHGTKGTRASRKGVGDLGKSKGMGEKRVTTSPMNAELSGMVGHHSDDPPKTDSHVRKRLPHSGDKVARGGWTREM